MEILNFNPLVTECLILKHALKSRLHTDFFVGQKLDLLKNSSIFHIKHKKDLELSIARLMLRL